jgi:multidrug efflux pump subunit AcrA (membrane-fusion protein)
MAVPKKVSPARVLLIVVGFFAAIIVLSLIVNREGKGGKGVGIPLPVIKKDSDEKSDIEIEIKLPFDLGGESDVTEDGQGGKDRRGESSANRTAPNTAAYTINTKKDDTSLAGVVIAARQVTLYAQNGGRVVELLKKVGDDVSKSEPVAYIEAEVATSALTATSAPQAAAPLRSTLSGTIHEMFISRGDEIAANSAVCTIGDQSSLAVEAYIPERYAVQRGLTVQIYFDELDGDVFTGIVSEYNPVPDEATRTSRAIINFAKSDVRIKSGMIALIKMGGNNEGR